VSRAGRPSRAVALGWLLLAACAGGRAGQPSGAALPAWARADKGPAGHGEPEVVRVVHRVEKGQTLFRIARTYGLSPEELAEANGLEVTAALAVGTELVIPGAVEPATVPPPGAPPVPVKPTPPVASVWETAVEPRAGQPLPPELLRAFEIGAEPPPSEPPLPDELVRAFDQPTPPPARPAAPPRPAAVAPRTSDEPRVGAVPASIGPSPAAEARLAPRTGTVPRGSTAAASTSLLQWPLRGVLYARFGKKGREPHDGIDLAAPAGTPVRTAAEGVVLFAGPQAGYGLIVLVQHERGLVTVYAHSRDVRVRSGQAVRPGQVIATVGESGKTSGPHLHFEVRVEGEPVDPMRFLGPVPAP
jgi:lipoprotein NlpD